MNIKREKPTVGMKIYVRGCKKWTSYIDEYQTVSKVGRKYFYLDSDAYHIDTWDLKTDYIASVILYASKSEYDNEIMVNDLSKKIRGFFGPYGKIDMSLSELKDIQNIIDVARLKRGEVNERA